ncbi:MULTISPECIES: polysaccharide deacetylase family protein [unclassified Clostridioides]|uniref:polysaccharide deacetylase family protein n=1 Tax=unclassified Clostridioides TaxID=2635829 RepID=UPI001D0C45EA|nr:polysaccharide deacetylase [Clostridioides sp. ES-S-0001-02]MCC0640157.1 polysaccharide deacetylase [Clostridioides sp. ES-S-0049-03]MCC0652062.1 polysaccharide deacetylase [Clostridioides sp. ES-S-0001-03]MCC0655601.1 polysaccharide deacetylase [Clostridioides sp. ES-S-0123-01]MCC0674620.1 polysaccharide deacetylase [Clostridioides sp. ES-W-0018-02]MCC0679143.1 polysaccharide deacetylase [Clostridioides sp. ES-S-0005-03]MCC0694441.1 polysaccharide deacetylase [Clostridioides sp. ES-S-0048
MRNKKKKINRKRLYLLLSAIVVCLAFIIIGIRVSYMNMKEDEISRNAKLSSSTITDIISNTSAEVSKGPSKSSGKVAYITIDDGPSKFTDQMIKTLNKYNVKATFFMIDGNMKEYPQQVKNIIKNGNTAGFHSVSHDIHKLYVTSTSAKDEFDTNDQTLYSITGKHSKVIRIPYGSKPYTPQASYQALVDAGYKIWDWDLDTEDWKSNSAQIVQNVKAHIKNRKGEDKDQLVVLMHEKKQSAEALDSILKFLSDEGYEFAAVEQNQIPKNYWLRNLE